MYDYRRVQLDSINKYMCIWTSYERKYLSSAKAQKFLSLKNELDAMLELSKFGFELCVPECFYFIIIVEDSLATKIKLLEARVSSDNSRGTVHVYVCDGNYIDSFYY